MKWFLILQIVCNCTCTQTHEVKLPMPSKEICQQIAADAGYNAQCWAQGQ
jgi:hypothetical protein